MANSSVDALPPRLSHISTTLKPRFSLALSANSSRAPSPSPLSPHNLPTPNPYGVKTFPNGTNKTDHLTLTPARSEKVSDSPGNLAADVYDATLPAWRAAIRRQVIKSVEWESHVLASMQNFVRTPVLDAYFVYTSSLGTHTFFMTVLPGLFFFGYAEMGRGLLIILALGVYLSSFVKDLVCSPRPFAPPVTRLTIGSHHLEYGFPSTHSTNSISIALFLFTYLHRLAHPAVPLSTFPSPSVSNSTFIPVLSDPSSPTPVPAISHSTYVALTILLVWYAFSIVFGRLYTAMHSFTDCAVGVLMGAGIWWVHDGYWSWGGGLGAWVEGMIEGYSWEVPLVIVPLCLVMVNQHPQPVDDCPCFEDAIAFVSVGMGSLLARWHAVQWGFDEAFFKSVMPGSLGDSWEEMTIWWAVAAAKMFFGVLVIFAWRILAKSTLHALLPPTFRLLSQSFTLPNRRFYTPATDYGSVPSGIGLHPIPSVIDLPGELGVEGEGWTWGEDVEVSGVGRGGGVALGLGERAIKMRGTGAMGKDEVQLEKRGKSWELEKNANGDAGGRGKDGELVKHYDADVLTKVIVYCGISVLACEVLPVMFEVLGWGVKSWV